jgi:hypothetical protein
MRANIKLSDEEYKKHIQSIQYQQSGSGFVATPSLGGAALLVKAEKLKIWLREIL